MDEDIQTLNSETHCCEQWWSSLTPVQKLYLHTHLWDLEILAGWESEVLVRSLDYLHRERVGLYTPIYSNGNGQRNGHGSTVPGTSHIPQGITDFSEKSN